MHPHLVRAPGFELRLHPGRLAQILQQPPVGHGVLAGLHLDAELLSIVRIATVQGFDTAGVAGGLTDGQGFIDSSDTVDFEIRAQRRHGYVVLGHHQQPRRILVDPVHYARPQLAADAAQILAMRQEGIDQRSVFVTHSRMNHQPGRLVDDHQAFVLEHHTQRDVLGHKLDLTHRWGDPHDLVTAADLLRRR